MSTGARSDRNSAYFQAIVPGRAQKLDFGNTSQQSEVFNSDTTLIRLFSTQDCYLAFGKNPTVAVPGVGATEEKTVFLAGGIYEYVGVEPGERLAVIRDSGDGTLHITEAL